MISSGADSVIESQSPCVCLSAPSEAIFFETSHWPSYHIISARPLICPPSLGNLETPPFPSQQKTQEIKFDYKKFNHK